LSSSQSTGISASELTEAAGNLAATEPLRLRNEGDEMAELDYDACRICGAMVDNRNRHAQWHAKLELDLRRLASSLNQINTKLR
jgi:hypothetical protein